MIHYHPPDEKETVLNNLDHFHPSFVDGEVCLPLNFLAFRTPVINRFSPPAAETRLALQVAISLPEWATSTLLFLLSYRRTRRYP